jgi:hypothetical protein
MFFRYGCVVLKHLAVPMCDSEQMLREKNSCKSSFLFW